MSERRVADLLQARAMRLLGLTLAICAALLTAVFAAAGELVLGRSLEQSSRLIESLLGRYADPRGERTAVAPAMLADELLGVGDAFLITRTVTEAGGRATIYFLTADMPAKPVAPGAARESVRDSLVEAFSRRGRWRYRLLHRRSGDFDIYVAGSRRPYLMALAAGSCAALLLLPAAALFAHRATRRSVGETLAPLEVIVHETRAIDPDDLSRRLTAPTGVAELTVLADAVNELIVRVERAHQSLEAFTADASHELRTPLTHLRAQAQWALAEHRGGEEMREALAAIVHDVDEATRMVEDLLLLARGENRQLKIAREPFDLLPVVQEVEEITLAMASGRDLEVRSLLNGPSRALGDALRTRQILLNLGSNAVRYTDGGSIRFAIAKRERLVGVVVRDTGIGIATEHLALLFDRFFRVEPSRARSRGGAGLGLTIARLLAELQGGHIEVVSSPGEGSAFTLWLPAAD